MAALSPHVWPWDGHGGAQDVAQLKDGFSRARHRVLSLWVNEPGTVLSAEVLLTVTLPLLTRLPHHSTSLDPPTFFVPTMILVSAWHWKAV